MKKALLLLGGGLLLAGTAYAVPNAPVSTPELPAGFAPFVMAGGTGMILYLRRFFKK
ncbi:MAG TPA: hypothetical protein VL404_03385 [Candidatus Eisenbacteria bacterium]|nr:hypothetical protein [Candidatus Eisenbacteria bacterium]